MSAILTIQNAHVKRDGQPIFQNLNLCVEKGNQVAIVGPSGSGKTALLDLIAGRLILNKGSIRYHLTGSDPGESGSSFSPHGEIALVSSRYGFKTLSNTSDIYYQQRFNSLDSSNAPTVQQYLVKHFRKTEGKAFWTLEKTVNLLRLFPLMDKELIKLSNGETKRLLIAAALLRQPALLLLDNPLSGLDIDTRAYFNELLEIIIGSGISVMMTTGVADIPESVTHIVFLKDFAIESYTKKENVVISDTGMNTSLHADDGELINLLAAGKKYAFKTVVQMNKVNVKYGDKQILNNVDVRIEAGERWALVGPNGAGKSTLLSLITGDNPQAYANDIVLFDRKRGTGESIWDIKSKIGFVSPELFQYFPTTDTCLQVVESGCYDTLGMFRRSIPANAELAMRWLKVLGLDHVAAKRLQQVSASHQRIVLLARALVNCPPLLIFDEPCQGLDQQQQERFKNIVDTICRFAATTLIYVSHYWAEIPSSVTKILEINEGKVTSKER